DGGCGCRTPGGQQRSSLAWVALLGLIALRRRRR
ncbi:MAG: MYXO-CTERM sorting domain-containing protein, partial [Deltaproteobacteria bacterium]|nr:MYXO-CTERM sorting domain-containing protein [Deltaproteobacteria bacterium]MBW2537762.1 MYXO-CTERM sorting domain-containing protein [Deltaproteobacteria bacterium]